MSGAPKRVVVTGLGALTPFGTGSEALRLGLRDGRCAIGVLPEAQATGLAIRVGARLPDEAWKAEVPDDLLRRECRTTAMAYHAAVQALRDAGLDPAAGRQRIAVLLGTGAGPVFAWAEAWRGWITEGLRGVRPMSIMHMMPNNAASTISIRLGLTGEHQVITAACASSTAAIGRALQMIRAGHEERVLVGGFECPFEPGTLAAWNNLRVAATESDPQRACRPFDRARSGLVLGEGAGMLVLEDADAALRRGARIHAEIAGYGATSDAEHIAQPSCDGQIAAIRRALADAALAPEQVGYINAHGTGTKLNDRVESRTIRSVFGDDHPPVSSTKSMHGHLLGAGGAVETMACVFAVRDGLLPPTVGFAEADPECLARVVPNHAVEKRIDVALNHSFAFGGNNSVLAITRWREAS